LGEGHERVALERLAAALGVEDYFRLVGFMDNPFAWLRDADLFVLPSIWEPFGIALAEAMALGLPVIVSDTDGARALVEHGAEGLIVPINDPAALAQAIIELANDPARRAAMGARSASKARRFDAPVVAEQYRAALLRAMPSVAALPQRRPAP
jgi:glycosyltransferase involved in cell wall biosynthesis